MYCYLRMREELLSSLIGDFNKKPYVEAAMLITRIGIPVTGKAPPNLPVEIFATMSGVTFGGAEEMVGQPKERLKNIFISLDGRKKIVLKGLVSSYILVLSVNDYNDQIESEISTFIESLSKGL